MNALVENTIAILFREVPLQKNSKEAHKGVALTMEAAPTLHKTPKGSIQLTLRFVSENAAVIANPLYYVKFDLFDEHHKPIPMAPKAPVLLLHLNRPLDPAKDFPFQVEKATTSEKDINTTEVVNKTSLEFAAQTSYAFTLGFPSAWFKENSCGYLKLSGNIVPFSKDGNTKSSNSFHTDLIPIRPSS
ncbi:hypothetical protein [Echinicola vietnamensis]|uniref:Uncharacterized protein n=1 Tax=Echinicola vietnamensis (strain DSM 17526 / LMG 23754 / KMM 6221) TaxID=926556 RepID=L0G4P4_ECHVK|nr:hypothetical protein [Echinicola vietnamensis]AGA79800.1 hypothetical protein Echvi_3584 [Echinicola vietnamensis DSM 17526]